VTRDIRMKGFTGTTSLEEALAVIRDRVKPLPPEEIALDGAVGRVVASDVRSAVDIPAFARSAVDGYACRAEDTFGAGPFDAIELKVAFEVLAGKKPPRPLGRGEAARVMTGAPVPDGSDSVVMFEHVEARDASIRLVQALPPGKNVITRGEDVKKDEVVAPRGRRVRADDLGLLTSIRAGTLRVHRRPTIIIYSSGNELVRADSATQGDVEIVDSNGPMLAALALHEGIAATRGGILRDDRTLIADALRSAKADVIVTTGAASTGKEDWMPVLLSELGELWVHGVSIRPAHPIGFGRLGERLVFLLPGNPVAAFVGFRYFVRPALNLLGGIPVAEAFAPERTRRAVLAKKIQSVIGRTDFTRVRFLEDGRVEPIRTGGASALTTLTRAAGIVTVPRDLEGLEEGTEVEVDLL